MIQVIGINNKIVERIEELNQSPIKLQKLTVRSIAQEIGISENHLWKIIGGKRNPSQEVQFALAMVLECPVEDIFIPIMCTQST